MRYCVKLCSGGRDPRTRPFVEALWQLTAAMQNAAPFITERYHQVARLPSVVGVFFPCILRAVQVGAQEYFHQVSTNIIEGHTGAPLPDLRNLVGDLKRGTFHQSNNWIPIPEEYMVPQRASTASTSGRHQPPLLRQRRCGPGCLASRPTLVGPPSPESRTLRRKRTSPASKFDREEHAPSYASDDHPQTTRATSFSWSGG